MYSQHIKIISIIILGFVLRIILSPYYTHSADMGLWKYWADQIYFLGFDNFYNKISWTDYLPFYFYILYFIKITILQLQPSPEKLDLIFKLPAIISDLLTALLIFLIAKKHFPKYSLTLTTAYTFNPVLFANSAMWGQVDSIGALLIIISLFLYSQKKFALIGVSLAAAILFKPLYLFAIPVFFIAILHASKSIPKFLGLFIATVFLITYPFTQNLLTIPETIYQRYTVALDQYQFASVNAFNLWGLLGKNWIPDNNLFLGISYHIWGLGLLSVVYLTVLFLLLKKRSSSFLSLTFALSITFIAVFTLPTRVHERHLLTFFPLVLLLTAKYSRFLYLYLILSIVYVINLFFSINYLFLNGKFIFSTEVIQFYSVFTLLSTILLFVSFIKMQIK